MWKLTTTWLHNNEEQETLWTDFKAMMQHILDTPSIHLGMQKVRFEPQDCETFPDLDNMTIS